jgi:hypothetical protein
MMLEEAIQHCRERALSCDACGGEHLQLAQWLEELLQYRRTEADRRAELHEVKSELRAYQEAEGKGVLVHLACRPYEAVYVIESVFKYEKDRKPDKRVKRGVVQGVVTGITIRDGMVKYHVWTKCWDMDLLQEQFFLTRETAETELKKLEELEKEGIKL